MRSPIDEDSRCHPLAYKGRHDMAGRYPVGYVVGEDGEQVSRV